MSDQIQSQMRYPDYVTSHNGRVIYRFLSNLADHFTKNHFWIKSQYGLYADKFKNVPADFLTRHLKNYLMNEVEWLPTLKKVAEYIHEQQDFKEHWHRVPLDKQYCEHCRTDADGKDGGFREIHYYGYRKSLDKKAEAHYKGACDCELGKQLKHRSYIEIIEWMRAQDQFAEINYSFYDYASNRIVTAQEQSSIHWKKKIDAGIIRYGDPEQGENEGALYPCWDHPIYSSVFGRMMCETYGFEMPEHIKEKYEATRRDIHGYTAQRDANKQRNIIDMVTGEGGVFVAPKSLADLWR